MKVLRLILASESARRVDLLDTAGYVFEARKSGFPELALEDPVETVRANAEGKALAVEREHGTVVLAADTIVYVPHLPVDERILGQARHKEDVKRFISICRDAHIRSSQASPSQGTKISPCATPLPACACEPSVPPKSSPTPTTERA